jgi:hypothetical protein
VFAGAFTLDSAIAVIAGSGILDPEAVESLANLVAKSLVSADVSGAVAQYRLLDTTRAYALQKLAESGELEALERRHVEHPRDLLEQAEAEWERDPPLTLPLDCHDERGDSEFGTHLFARGPANHLAGEQVEDHGQVEPALASCRYYEGC